ncbi:hypothetical protein K435DRAFT_794160 [Dendrothele bispora CBS 962.96]|uniref:Uncharacterized protein n=1 Tax=Dendrothele bispora (strain CBS 962.96) TaxID=1314807 RepID=A0A4S8MD44_DENBC|nr:hypothetical protein K435DRAFT_794160 [Dendrothele bispora CBS 962.96]
MNLDRHSSYTFYDKTGQLSPPLLHGSNVSEQSLHDRTLAAPSGLMGTTVRGDTPPGAGEPGVTLKERLDKFNAANNVQGVAVTVQSVNVAYTRDTYEMEELREALREKERETAQYRQAQVSSQFMNGAAAYQPLPDHPGMKPPENDSDTQSKEKVGSKPPANVLSGRADDREGPEGVEKKTPYKYKIPQKKFDGVELEPTVNGRRVPAAPFQGVKDVTSMAKPGPTARPAFAGGVKEKEGKTVRFEPSSWNTNRYLSSLPTLVIVDGAALKLDLSVFKLFLYNHRFSEYEYGMAVQEK